jgi:hypothetical protein
VLEHTVGGHDNVHQAPAQRRGGIDRLAGQRYLQCPPRPDHVWQPDQATAGREDAALYLGQGEQGLL